MSVRSGGRCSNFVPQKLGSAVFLDPEGSLVVLGVTYCGKAFRMAAFMPLIGGINETTSLDA